MEIRTTFPFPIRELENIWIPLPDGSRLAARIWLPESAENDPVPALLEYIPYRKNDGTAVRDSIRHPYLAGHGYACVRVDMRGSGDSDGILYDEYLPQEQQDCLDVLAWIAGQPWCSGRIGMFGKSWGGFNALQVAALRPPSLKAIITIASTDDRYADDVHYAGGSVLAHDMLPWAAVMLAGNATPPDPRWVGERWREIWLRRIEETPSYLEIWLAHQRRDAYWRHGSVCEDFAAIEIPVFAVGGWADGYTNAVFRLLAGLKSPCLGLVGPWAHNFPEEGSPGPAVGFLQESLRWWDYWLKDRETGIMAEPRLRSWLQESVPPRTAYDFRPGRWAGDPEWPSPYVTEDAWTMADHGRLLPGAPAAVSFEPRTTRPDLTAGFDLPAWCPYGQPGDFAPDQRGIDGRWLSFTSGPLPDGPLDYLGFPEVDLRLVVDRPLAQVAVRLCDVAPDGSSTLVSWGVLNLTHRHGHARPEPIPVGEEIAVTVALNAIGHTVLPDHRWRVSISPAYFPMIWPSPEMVMMTLAGGELRLPRRRDEAGRAASSLSFLPPESAPRLPLNVVRTPEVGKKWERDGITGRESLTVTFDEGRLRFAGNGLEIEDRTVNRYAIVEGEPCSAEVSAEHLLVFERGEWRVRVETFSRMTADAAYFHVTNQIDAYEGEVRVATRTWHSRIARDGV